MQQCLTMRFAVVYERPILCSQLCHVMLRGLQLARQLSTSLRSPYKASVTAVRLRTYVQMPILVVQVDEGSFVRNKEALVQKYQNANMSPDRHASYLRLRALKQMWRMEDVLAELQALTPAGVQVR